MTYSVRGVRFHVFGYLQAIELATAVRARSLRNEWIFEEDRFPEGTQSKPKPVTLVAVVYLSVSVVIHMSNMLARYTLACYPCTTADTCMSWHVVHACTVL